eukprot:3765420-Ditylum_brightwellii.AAC.1
MLYILLNNVRGSVTLIEQGNSEALQRHPDFCLFAAMNPVTYSDPVELHSVMAQYLSGAIETSSDGGGQKPRSIIYGITISIAQNAFQVFEKESYHQGASLGGTKFCTTKKHPLVVQSFVPPRGIPW